MSTAVKERPILFSAEMVRAILEGRKSQTRRIIKPQPPDEYWSPQDCMGSFHWNDSDKDDDMMGWWPSYDKGLLCPYGSVGDRLWVRESFSTDIRDPLNCVIYNATPEYGKYRDTGELVRASFADGSLPTREEAKRAMLPKFWKGKPSIHMPRWASRITLEITGVRVERLCDISEEDAIAEGSQCAGVPASLTNRGAFAKLWESINGGDSWKKNPFVWVLEFRVTK